MRHSARFPRTPARARPSATARAMTRALEPFTRLEPAPDVTIEKEKFTKTIKLLALRVPKVREVGRTTRVATCRRQPPDSRLALRSLVADVFPILDEAQARCQQIVKDIKPVVLDLPRHRSVLSDPRGDPDVRLVLLAEDVRDRALPTLDAERRERAKVADLEFTEHELTLGYDYFNAEQILRQVLPNGCEVPGSFETVGHIAHLNLRDEVRDYRHLIGRVLLDKNPRLKTVVNKVGSIASEYRVPAWELLAGDTSLETEVRQHGVPFRLDFGEVYWNSRLEAEHKRLVDEMKPGEILCDAMAGVGPFAVPAAKAGLRVYANDLNPHCARYLRENAAANRVKNLVKCYNLDARAFVRALLAPGPGPTVEEPDVPAEPESGGSEKSAGKRERKPAPKPPVRWAAMTPEEDEGAPPAGAVFDHVTMNLPASAIEFLDVFKGAFDRATWGDRKLPTIHCYTFKRADETKDDVIKRGEGHLGARMASPRVREVRDVAPNKIMLCLSFTLDPEVAFGEDDGEKRATDGGESKRPRTER